MEDIESKLKFVKAGPGKRYLKKFADQWCNQGIGYYHLLTNVKGETIDLSEEGHAHGRKMRDGFLGKEVFLQLVPVFEDPTEEASIHDSEILPFNKTVNHLATTVETVCMNYFEILSSSQACRVLRSFTDSYMHKLDKVLLRMVNGVGMHFKLSNKGSENTHILYKHFTKKIIYIQLSPVTLEVEEAGMNDSEILSSDLATRLLRKFIDQYTNNLHEVKIRLVNGAGIPIKLSIEGRENGRLKQNNFYGKHVYIQLQPVAGDPHIPRHVIPALRGSELGTRNSSNNHQRRNDSGSRKRQLSMNSMNPQNRKQHKRFLKWYFSLDEESGDDSDSDDSSGYSSDDSSDTTTDDQDDEVSDDEVSDDELLNNINSSGVHAQSYIDCGDPFQYNTSDSTVYSSTPVDENCTDHSFTFGNMSPINSDTD